MTIRELLSVLLTVAGATLIVVAAGAYGGWKAAVAALGVLMLGGGVLLGLDTGPAELEPTGDSL